MAPKTYAVLIAVLPAIYLAGYGYARASHQLIRYTAPLSPGRTLVIGGPAALDQSTKPSAWDVLYYPVTTLEEAARAIHYEYYPSKNLYGVPAVRPQKATWILSAFRPKS